MSEQKHSFKFADDFVGYANIKVVGVGGAGGNAINRMIEAGLKGVEFIAVNTDAQVLDQNRADKKVQIGRELTGGLGAGANPEIGKQAIEENCQEVAQEISKPNLVFITAGMGGGTGFEYATQWSVSLGETVTFLLPSFYGFGGVTYWGKMPFTDYPNYMGILLLLLAVWAVAARRSWFVWTLAAGGFLAYLLSLGNNFFLYKLFYNLFPYFNKFAIS